MKTLYIGLFFILFMSGCSFQFFPDSWSSWEGYLLIAATIIGLIVWSQDPEKSDNQIGCILTPFFAWLFMQLIWLIAFIFGSLGGIVGDAVVTSAKYVEKNFGTYSSYESKVEMPSDVPYSVESQILSAENKVASIIEQLTNLDAQREKLIKIREKLPFSSTKALNRVEAMLTIIRDNRSRLITALQYLRDQIDTVKIQISIEIDNSQPQITKLLEVLDQTDQIIIQVQNEMQTEKSRGF